MSKQLKSSSKGTQRYNFSLKCVKTLQKCIKDLKRAMRQMQFESQRLQKHQIQQILNNTSNLLTALSSCNLYRIHYQDETYYLTQLQKIEKSIGEIVDFVSLLSSRQYFTNLANNSLSEDLFLKLESSFDTFIGPLLHIFNTFNVNWLLFQCSSIKLFLLDEFDEEKIIKKLGIDKVDTFIDHEMSRKYSDSLKEREDTSMVHLNSNIQDSSSKDEMSSQQITLENTNLDSLKAIENNSKPFDKIEGLKQQLKNIGSNNNKKVLFNELLNEYKQKLPENTCISELALMIDFISDQTPQNYKNVFMEYYIQLFDNSTSEKISKILEKTHSFAKLNHYCRQIFYNAEIMLLPINEIISYIHYSSHFEFKDLKMQLVRSGFNQLPVPVTTSPLHTASKSRKKRFNFQNNLHTNALDQPNDNNDTGKNGNHTKMVFTSSEFQVGQVITLCPHQSNFFSSAPQVEKFTGSQLKEDEICCQYVKQQIMAEIQKEKEIDENFSKRSSTISQRRSELFPSSLTKDILKTKNSFVLKHQNTFVLESGQDNEDDDEKEGDEESPEFLLKKKELLFGRRADNFIFKPDFLFENNEFSISRQQFKISYEDQTNEYNVQCMSHSNLTQLVIDDVGFELTVGSVFVIQDLIAFQVISQKQFSESVLNGPSAINLNSKVFHKQSSTNPGSPLEKDHHQKQKQLYKNSRQKGSNRLSYKSSQLFEDHEGTLQEIQQKVNEGDAIKTSESEQSSVSKSDSENENEDFKCNNASENDSSSVNTSFASTSSASFINNVNQMQHHFEKRSSLNTKKNSFINRMKTLRSGSLIQCSTNDSNQTEQINGNNGSSSNEIPSPPPPKLTAGSQLNSITTQSQEEQNDKQSQNLNTQKSASMNESPQINLIRCQSENDEITQDFKKVNQQPSEKVQNLGVIQQSTLMNVMSLSSSRAMLQSNLNLMNQSSYSIAGQSLYEIEDDQLTSNEALLHIRVLWSNIETEKEDYVFQYSNPAERDQIVINIGSDKSNQVRIQDENKSIKLSAHCTITYTDNTWTLVTNHQESRYYTGLALKKIEEIESGLVSKKILIENGFNILVQGYIFKCEM